MMEIYTDIYGWTPPDNGCVMAIGRFDGVHLGHRFILERTELIGKERGLVPVCFSFQENTYPGAIERGQLTSSDEKAQLMEEIGIEVLLHPEFKSPLIDMTAYRFINELMVKQWNTKYVVVGYDFRFGKGREGDAEFLKSEGNRRNIEVEIVEPFELFDSPVKATAIRSLISDGYITQANKLLGRKFSIDVVSLQGKKLGRRLGFPTVNFDWQTEKVKPRYGIYAVKIESCYFKKLPQLDGKTMLDGVANFGLRPTIEPENTSPLLKVHILNDLGDPEHIQDLLSDGIRFRVYFHAFIREERRFGSVDELQRQIALDCESARMMLRDEQ